MDIKNSKERYLQTAGMKEEWISKVCESVSYLKEGHVPYEFRTTVTKNFHTKEDFERIGKWIEGTEKYFLQKFVDSGDLIDNGVQGCTDEEMKEFLLEVQKYVPYAQIRG